MPFALLAAAQLVAVGAGLSFAGAVLRPPLRARGLRGLLSGILAAVGILTIAAADALTGARIGLPDSSPLLVVHAIGFVLLAAGLSTARPAVPRAAPTSVALAIAPLGASVGPAAAGVLAGVLAAASLLRHRAVPGVRLLTAGLLAQGAALAAAPAARTHAYGADTLLSLRLVGGLLVLAALAFMARTSVLSKIVTALGLGVLATAIATAAIVGTVISDQLASDQEHQLGQATVGAATDLIDDTATAEQLAQEAASCGTGSGRAALAATETCAAGVAKVTATDGFSAVITPNGPVRVVGGSDPLDRAALLDLQSAPVVEASLVAPGSDIDGFVVLHGAVPQLVALGLAPVRNSADPSGAPLAVVIYGAAIDTATVDQARSRSTFDATVLSLPYGSVLASSLSADQANAIAAQATPLLASLPTASTVTRLGQGRTSATGYAVLETGLQRTAVLVMSASSATVLHSQRTVLDVLFLALVAIIVLISAIAAALGRRAVEPIRRLTVAARAVGRGDLSVRPSVGSVDEVGQLASVFSSMTGSLQGLTDDLRSTAQEEAATRARLATVLDAIGDGLVVTDAAGRIELANPAAVRLLGEVVGAPIGSVVRDVLGTPLGDGDGVLSGPAGVVAVSVARADLPGGRGQVFVIADRTAARQLERAKTEFLSNVSHELRTPLTPIQGYADILRRRATLPRPKVTEMAESIAVGARRMSRVVGLLVDVAALDAGRVLPAPGALDVGVVLDARLTDWRVRAPQRAGDLRRRIEAGTPAIYADASWLARSLDELIDNALAQSEPGDPVVLSAAPAPAVAPVSPAPAPLAGTPSVATHGRVRIAVRDQGPGLDAGARAALFSDFAQADGSATRSRDGLGLGLAFVRRVAVILGASIGVESTPGRGASFYLDLPAMAPARRIRATGPRPGKAATVTPARARPRAGRSGGAAR